MPDAAEADETVALHEFTASNHMSVTNFYAARGLDLLSQVRLRRVVASRERYLARAHS